MDHDDTRSNPADDAASAGDEYGFSGRAGYTEGNYSGAYGRGSAGQRDSPSASGVAGGGYTHGGTDIPSPEIIAGEPVRIDEGDTGPVADASDASDAGDRSVSESSRNTRGRRE